MFMFRWLLFNGNNVCVCAPSCLPLAPQGFGMFHISPQNLFSLHFSFKPHSIKRTIQFLTFNFFQIQRFNFFSPSLKYALDLVCTVALTIGESACYVTSNPAVPNKVLFSWRLVWSEVLSPPETPKLIVELKQQMLTAHSHELWVFVILPFCAPSQLFFPSFICLKSASKPSRLL